jgi:tetratricopeptide (TPR) repeat protein
MRYACLIAFLALPSLAWETYDLTGWIVPPTASPVFLHGATFPFEASAMSGADGRFRFRRLAAGAYTLAVPTAARGTALQTIELTPGTVDSKGRLDILVRIDPERLDADKSRAQGSTVSAVILSVPDRAMKEYGEAQRCLSRRETACATGHLKRAVEMAPHFVAAWNELGTIAYQSSRFSDAEKNFRRALDADSQAFEPLVNLGGVLLNLNRSGEALGYNREAAARRPNDALANSQLGLTYFELDDLPQAEKYLKNAVRLDPGHFSHPQLVLGEIYARRGDLAAAIASFREFLALHPDSPQASGVRNQIAELSRR